MIESIADVAEIFEIFIKNFLITYFTFKFFQFVAFYLCEFVYSGTELDPYAQLNEQLKIYERLERKAAAAKKRVRTPVFTRSAARNTVAKNTRAACKARNKKIS